jgi:YgiT-type zinc finger domain-containing protein
MTGHAGVSKPCPLCGGQLSAQLATIPFVLGKTIAVIKQVPAEVCDSCGEPFLQAEATDAVTELLDNALASSAEVSVMTYSAGAPTVV